MVEKKRKYSLEINWNKAELIKFLNENKIKMLNYKKGRMDSQNKVIQGDGIDAISSLLISGDKFEIVMIDPPYNENKSKGKYKDQWRGSGKDFNWAGENHGSYLDFLYPRIILGKESLTEDGIMMLFIGDGEQHYVRILMDKVFGEGNYIGTVLWDSNWSPTKNKSIDRKHEFVFIYAKNSIVFKDKLGGLYKINTSEKEPKDKLSKFAKSLSDLDFNEAQEKYLHFLKEMKSNGELTGDADQYKYIHPITFDIFCSAGSNDPRNGSRLKLKHPKSGKDCSMPETGWRFSEEYLKKINGLEETYTLHDGKIIKILVNSNSERVGGIIFGKDESTVPRSLYLHNESSNKVVLKTTGHIYSSSNKKEGINSKTGFETVKPADFLVELLLNYPNKNARILDNFAGSGTTAVSVEMANKIDDGKRSWTMVELNETTVKDVLLPKLAYFKVKDFKEMNIKACNLKTKDVDSYFRKFMNNYIQSEREYIEINKESQLGYSIIGVEGDTLILSTLQKEDSDKAPRPSLFAKELMPHIGKDIKKVFVYLVGSEHFKSSWEVLIKDTVVNKTNIASKDIKIFSLPNEIKSKWEGLVDNLSQYEDKKKD